jgi:hypothetical protein
MKHKPKHKTDKRAEALKANLAKRKDQARAKAQKSGDTPE